MYFIMLVNHLIEQHFCDFLIFIIRAQVCRLLITKHKVLKIFR